MDGSKGLDLLLQPGNDGFGLQPPLYSEAFPFIKTKELSLCQKNRSLGQTQKKYFLRKEKTKKKYVRGGD